MNARYLPYVVYKNLEKFAEYRKLISKSDNLKEKEFIEKIQIDGYVIIELEDSDDKQRRYLKSVDPHCHEIPTKTYIIIIEPNNAVGLKSANFEKMLKTISHFTSKNRKYNLEINIITKELFKANIKNKLETFLSSGSDESGYIQILNYGYNVFIMVIPDHMLVPPHRLLTIEEEELVLSETFIKKRDMPKLAKTDPNVIWHGGITGDVFEILSPSEATGTEVHYRCVL